MSALPFMPVYVADYLADTTHLSTEEHGAYLLLMFVMWKAGGTLPNDDKALSRITRLSVTKWLKVKPSIICFFEVTETEISQKRITKEIQKAKNLSEVRSDVGKRGAEAKSLKTKKPHQAIACDLLKQTPQQNDSKPLPSYTSDSIEDIGREDAGARPDDFQNKKPDVTQTDLAQLESQLREAAGWEREPSPQLFVTGEIYGLLQSGCDLNLDVLPVIRTLAPNVKRRSSWKYFIGAIQQSRDDRIAASSQITNPSNQRKAIRQNEKPATALASAFDDLRNRLEGHSNAA